MVRPPSKHQAFSGPCTPNGIAPTCTASRNRCTHGSPAGSVASRGQCTTSAPKVCKRATSAASANSGTNTVMGHLTARANVLAAKAALPHEAIASDGRASLRHEVRPNRSAATRCNNSVNKWRDFCEPATLWVSSLIHTPPFSEKPSSSDNLSARANGVNTNPVPATVAMCVSSSTISASRSVSLMPWA